MLKSLTITAALLASASLCFAQDKPADAETLPGAKFIDLQLEGASPEEAFAELGKQADVQIKPMVSDIWAKADPVDLKIENGHFWPVFLEMCQQANVRYNPSYYMGDPKTIQIFGPEQGVEPMTKLPQAQSMGTILVLEYANRNYSLSYANPQQSNTSFSIQGMLLCDPGVQFSGQPQARITEAVDENGASLAPPQNQEVYYGDEGRLMVRRVHMSLSYPKNAGKKLVRLKGEIKATVIAKSGTLTIDPLTDVKPQKKELTSMTVEITSVKTTDDSAEVRVTIESKRPLRGMDQNMWSLMQAIQVTDADGKRYTHTGTTHTGGSDRMMTAIVRFGNTNSSQPLGKPAKLSWTLPVETKDVQLPFEFKDLPIP